MTRTQTDNQIEEEQQREASGVTEDRELLERTDIDLIEGDTTTKDIKEEKELDL